MIAKPDLKIIKKLDAMRKCPDRMCKMLIFEIKMEMLLERIMILFVFAAY